MTDFSLHKTLLAVGLALIASQTPASESTVLGRAFDRENGTLLYSEHHTCTARFLECSVEYRDDSGALIVHKTLNYQDGPYSPALRIHDYRMKTTLVLDPTERAGLVVDAGFDNFVRSRWDQLSAGENVKFPFQVVGFDNPLNMIAKQDTSTSCAKEEMCLVVTLDSWLLGLLAKPINLAYSKQGQQLLRYQGISNIRDADGDAFFVDIQYSYDESGEAVMHSAQPDPVTYQF